VKHILVVEDDLSISNLISYNLEQAGYRVVTAFDGAEAVRLVDSCCPHLVTLDLLLPRQSGWEVLHAIRNHPRRQVVTLPVIVLSALCSPQLRADLGRNGVEHCLGKPFSVTELCMLVHSLLATRLDVGWGNPL
jgi:two-component system alkaline phosphatase synthesis response regulator PhoP